MKSKKSQKMLDKVRNTIEKYNLIKKRDRVLIGLSGGPDSVTLLYVLNNLKKELKIDLCAAHLDHGLRKYSHKDREFVINICRKLKVPIELKRVNMLSLPKKGSTEEAARKLRFNFLFQAAKHTKSDKIALGHNLDDQAETVLMRILRGTGLYGLLGILPKRTFDDFTVIRPMIEVKRKEIEAYLRKRKIKALIDPSNSEEIYFRNKIRNNLLPLLEKTYNHNIKEVLANMAQSLGYDYDYLTHQANLAMKRPRNRLIIKRLQILHPALRRLILRQAITEVKGSTRRITFQHINEIEDLIFNRPINSIVDLPKGISARKKRNTLSFYLKSI